MGQVPSGDAVMSVFAWQLTVVAVPTQITVSPSLASGRLTILDRSGAVRRELKVARAAHDACILR